MGSEEGKDVDAERRQDSWVGVEKVLNSKW